MKRKLFSLLAAAMVFSAAVLGWSQSTRAALCSKCRDLMFVDSAGKCIDCGGPTASGALQLCPKCSAKRHQCEHCLAATTEKDEVTGREQAGRPGGANIAQRRCFAQQCTGLDPAGRAPGGARQSCQAGRRCPGRADGSRNQPLAPARRANGKAAPPKNLPESKPPAELPPDPVPGTPQADQSVQGGHVYVGKMALPTADYQPRHPQRRPLGLADLRRPEVAAGQRQRLLQYSLGSDLLGRCANDRLGSSRLDAGPAGTRPTARQATSGTVLHVGRRVRLTRACNRPHSAAGIGGGGRAGNPAGADPGNQQVAQRPVGPAAGRPCSGDPPAGQSGDGLSMAGRYDEQSGHAVDRAAPVLAPGIDRRASRGTGHVHVHLPGRAARNRLDPPLLYPSRRSQPAA